MDTQAIGTLGFDDRLPDEAEIGNAKQIADMVAASLAKEGEPKKVSLFIEDGEMNDVTLMPSLAASMLELLRLVSSGRGFRLIPVETELTVQQAADLLNVSRSYLVKLLDEGEIPCASNRGLRFIRADDLFAYKKKRDAIRSKALCESLFRSISRKVYWGCRKTRSRRTWQVDCISNTS